MIAAAPKLRLDSKHRYWLGKDRKPGFTEICTAMGVIVPNDFYTESGRLEGNALHEWLQWLAKGKPERVPHPSIAGRVEGIKKFLRDTGFRIVGGEEPQYDPTTDSCCTPDLWGFIGSEKYVIDAKRGSPLPHHALQTAAQSLALHEFRPIRRAGLYLKDHGYRLRAHTDPADFNRWRSTAHAFHVAQNRRSI